MTIDAGAPTVDAPLGVSRCSPARSRAGSTASARRGSRARSPSGAISGGNVYGKLKDLEVGRHDLVHHLVVGEGQAARRPQAGRPRRRAREAQLLGQGRHAHDAGVRDAPRRASATCSSGSNGCARSSRPRVCSITRSPCPSCPGCIGLVTGKDSDAEKDVLRNAQLRWPAVNFRVVHATVQGDRAAVRGGRRDPHARCRSRGRGHHRRARRRRLPEPARLQRRSARARGRGVRDTPGRARSGTRPIGPCSTRWQTCGHPPRPTPRSGWFRMSRRSSARVQQARSTLRLRITQRLSLEVDRLEALRRTASRPRSRTEWGRSPATSRTPRR